MSMTLRPALRGGANYFFPIDLIGTTRRRIPASASANQGTKKGDSVPL
jgi:hypothetical protein